MKILVLSSFFYPGKKSGGPQKSVLKMTESYKEILFIVLTRNKDLGEKVAYNLVPNKPKKFTNNVIVFYYSNPLKRILLTIGLLKKDVKHVIVNSFFDINSYLFLLIFRNINSFKLYLFPRGELLKDSLYFNFYLKYIYIFLLKPLYSKVTFVGTSESERSEIKKIFSKSIVKSFFNQVDKPNFEITNNIKYPIVANSEFDLYFIHFSRISEEKKLLFILQGIKKYQKSSIFFQIFGNIEDKEYFNKCKVEIDYINSIGLHKIVYSGFLDISSLNKVDSRSWMLYTGTGDNFGHVIYEALSHAIPCVLSKYTFFADIEKKNAGFIIELTEESFHKTLDQINKISDHQFKIMRINAYSLAKEYYNLSQFQPFFI